MDSKAIIAIAVVAVVVVAGVGAVMLVNNGSSDSSDNPLECKLRVLGNANQDNYLNDEDVDYIQDVIDGDIIWNRTTDPLVDANYDGIIDSSDIELVKKFINGTSATMYYLDWYNNVSSVQYPLTEVLGDNYGIHTDFSTGLDIGIILGIYDKFTYMSNLDITPSQLDTTMYPNAGNMTGVSVDTSPLDVEYAGGVRILMGDFNKMGKYFDAAETAGFTVIRLPENRTMNGVDSLDTLITLGVMFNLQNKTAPFIEFMDKVNQKVQDAIDSADADVLSYIIPYTAPGYGNACYVDAHGSSSITTADVTLLELLPVKSAVTTTAADGFDAMSADTLASYNPDIYVMALFAYSSGKNYTVDDYKNAFVTFVETGFHKTSAASNGKIFCMPFENCSVAGLASILVLASMIWPDEFDSDEAWDMMQEYYDTFTNFEGDVKESKFAPLSYSDLKA